MRILSLAVFALIAFAAGFHVNDAMLLGLGAASALAALASLPSLRIPTFLKLMSELFAVETVVFGAADIVNALGYWPQRYAEYALPRYLPIATAVFVIALTLTSWIPFVKRMMRIADPFFEARTPITMRPPFMAPRILRQSSYARACVVFLILLNQLQVGIGVRLNYFQMAFGNAIQVPDDAHRIAFWHQLLDVFTPLALIAITVMMVEFYVASNFVHDGVLHDPLVVELDALQAGGRLGYRRQS